MVGHSIQPGTPFEGMLKDGVDGVTVEGVANAHYDLPNLQLSVQKPKVNVPVLWWRSVGNARTAFASWRR